MIIDSTIFKNGYDMDHMIENGYGMAIEIPFEIEKLKKNIIIIIKKETNQCTYDYD